MLRAKLIFVLLLLFLPTQLGKHFWPEFAYVWGQRVDYLSPTAFLTDILIGILFLLEGRKVYQFFKKHRLLFLLSLFLMSLFSLIWIFSQHQAEGLLIYRWLKLAEFLFLAWWVKSNVSLKEILLPLSLSVLGSSLLAWAQFFKQGSLGFWLLGERTFHAGTPGIALANWQDRLILRPYATLPHPNALAGYILVVLILVLFSPGPLSYWRSLTLFLGTATMMICFSRTVWLVWGLTIAFWLLGRRKPGFLFSWGFLNFGGEAVWQRWQLTKAAWQMFKKGPLFGVGLGNFLPQLPPLLVAEKVYFWQPVHNLFLLILAETGLLISVPVFSGLVWLLKRLSHQHNWPLFCSLAAIIATGFFDHYWLTLQQTQLLLTLILGLSFKDALESD